MPTSMSRDDDANARPDAVATAARHDEWLMDEGIRGSFPASDPASIRVQRARPAPSTPLGCAEHRKHQREAAAYDQRAVTHYVELFQALDRDGDGTLTRSWPKSDPSKFLGVGACPIDSLATRFHDRVPS